MGSWEIALGVGLLLLVTVAGYVLARRRRMARTVELEIGYDPQPALNAEPDDQRGPSADGGERDVPPSDGALRANDPIAAGHGSGPSRAIIDLKVRLQRARSSRPPPPPPGVPTADASPAMPIEMPHPAAGAAPAHADVEFASGAAGASLPEISPASGNGGDRTPRPLASRMGLPKTDLDVVPVHYATDRRPNSDIGTEFTGMRGDGGLMYGIAEITIPPEHRPGEVERPKWWKLDFREDPERFVVIRDRRPLSEEGILAELRQSMARAGEREALLFIHGYNVEFDDALMRTAQLSYDLRFRGATLLYSWPSEGKVTSYAVDEANVEWTAPRLKGFLETILTRVDAEAVHVIAHSMGNRALVAAIREIDFAALNTAGAARLRQVVFTAPDVDAGTFREFAKDFERGRNGERFTLYASSKDKALEASQRFHRYPRAGDSDEIVIVEQVDTIDATEVETDFLGHSYFREAKSIISDLFYLIGHGLPPDDRALLRRQDHPTGPYWKFVG